MGLGTDPAGLAGAEVDGLIDDAERLLHRDPETCASLIDGAETAMGVRRDMGRSARISEIRGHLALAHGELGAAATAYRHARRNWLAVGRSLEAVRATLGCTQVQVLLGEFEEAESAVLRVQAQLGKEAPHEESRVVQLDAMVQRQLADARAGMGQMAIAQRHYDAAENLFAALGDIEGMALVSLRRGLAALDSGLAHNAMIELERARTGFRREGQERSAAVVVVLIAEALSATGRVARALELLDCVRPELAGSRWHKAFHRLARSHALLGAGLPTEAHAEARAAEDVFDQIGAVEQSARAALSCARASLRWGRTNVAASELAVAERLFAECGSHLMRARTWLVEAELALSLDDLDTAQARARRVIAAGFDETAPYLGVHARLVCARVEEPAEASALLDVAAALAARTGIPELRVEVLLARARHQRRLQRAGEAVETLKNALRIGHAWEQRMGDRGPGAASPALLAVTDELIALLLERGDHAARVEAWRRARAAKRASLAPFAGRPDQSDAGDEGGRARFEELVEESLRASAPQSDAAAEEVLPSVPWGSFVEYYVTGEQVIAFVLRDGQVDSRVLGDVAVETRRLVSAWQQECRLMAPGSGPAAGAAVSSPALDGLYEMLLAPIADLLADLDDELHVLGHRHLHAVPFDALLDVVGPWYSGLEGATWPGDETARSSDPRATATLVLAVPDENAPLITTEAEMIFRTLPSAQILHGTEATRDALAKRAGSADVVHFACHGVFRPDSPLSSALRLGDGWLSARDIIAGALGLEGSVVVLSACGSGLAPDHASEPVGLASACLAAGASGVVAALWTVDDAVTLELMTSFYEGLAEGLDPHSALRHARRQVARRHRHPYYWAAFRYVAGDLVP